MECPACGRQQDSSNRFCEACGRTITADDTAPGSATMFEQSPPPGNGSQAAAWPAPPAALPRPAAPPPGRTPDPRPLLFRLAHGEQVLKAYDVVTLRTWLFRAQRGHGTLYVTDARVVFYALAYPRGSQKASWLFQQTKLEDISGLSAHVSRRISLGLAVLTLFGGLATLAALLFGATAPAVLLAIVTAVFILVLIRDVTRRGDVGVTIQSRENGNSPISFGRVPRERGFFDKLGRLLIFPIALFLRSYNAFDVVAGDPADNSHEFLHELGALIIDLQTRGTMAYPEWNIPVPAGAVGAASLQ